MNAKFRDELREAQVYFQQHALAKAQASHVHTALEAINQFLALLSGTHETHWLAPKEPTEKMIQASNREWDGRMSHRSSGAYQAMRDACEEERRG